MDKKIEIKSNNDKLSFLPSGKRLWFWMYIVMAITIVFICIDHWFDMTITVWHSNDFLDCLFNGKITSFYNHTWEVANQGGYCGGGIERDAASYSPIVYFFIGILILPIYILDKIIGTNSVMLMESWVRLLMIIASFFAARLIRRIFEKSGKNTDGQNISLYFIGSPIFFLSVLIMNQYDIVGVILCLFAFDAYLEGKLFKFSGFIAVAMGFKFFPIIMFFPLLLLREKRIPRIIIHTLIAVVPYSIMMAIVKAVDPGYSKISYVVDGFIDRVFAAQIPAGISGVSIVVILYCLICVCAYLFDIKTTDRSNYLYWGSRIAFVAYLSFFLFIDAHEQWFVYLLPFMTLVFFTTENKDQFMLMETVFSLMFYIINAVTKGMIEYVRSSIMAITSGKEIDLETNINVYNKIFADATIPFSIMFGFAMAILVVVIFDTYKNRNKISDVLCMKNEINYPLWVVRTSTLIFYVVPLLYMYSTL